MGKDFKRLVEDETDIEVLKTLLIYMHTHQADITDDRIKVWVYSEHEEELDLSEFFHQVKTGDREL